MGDPRGNFAEESQTLPSPKALGLFCNLGLKLLRVLVKLHFQLLAHRDVPQHVEARYGTVGLMNRADSNLISFAGDRRAPLTLHVGAEGAHAVLAILAKGFLVSEKHVAQLSFTVAQLTLERTVHESDSVVSSNDVDAVFHAVQNGPKPIPLSNGEPIPHPVRPCRFSSHSPASLQVMCPYRFNLRQRVL